MIMTRIEANQLIAKMHEMKLQAQPQQRNLVKTDFQDVLKSAVRGVNTMQTDASALAMRFEQGEDVDLAEVMIANQKANIAFQGVLQVRNRLVQAYQDIMNMPI
jgi:flagellar hook-basal body complex protein FliE